MISQNVFSNLRRLYWTWFFKPEYEQDLFLASFPRSGNTWLRAILFHLTQNREPRNLSEIDFAIPDEHYHIPRRKIMKTAGEEWEFRSIVKTHAPYRFTTNYQNVIYVVRDPRDVIPSYYRYMSRKVDAFQLDMGEFTKACLAGAVGPGTWYDHVTSWKYFHERAPQKIKFVQYEKLKSNDANEIAKFGDALGLANVSDLITTFERYDLERMRRLENSGNRPNEIAKGFIGGGRAAAPHAEIVEVAIKKYAPHWYDLMSEFNYFN